MFGKKNTARSNLGIGCLIGLIGGFAAFLFLRKGNNKPDDSLAEDAFKLEEDALDLLETVSLQAEEMIEQAREIAEEAAEIASKFRE